MQYDISHLLREPVGFRWGVKVDEVGIAEPVKGERIQGQRRLTRFSQGVCAEALLNTEAVQICYRCLRTFRQHLILNLPAKLLCNPQCVGICPHCGVYGDKHNHNCRTQDQDFQADPRWKDLTALGFSGERGR